MFWPCETRTSTCRNFATISSGLYRFLASAVLLDVKDIPQVGPLQWGRINGSDQKSGSLSNSDARIISLQTSPVRFCIFGTCESDGTCRRSSGCTDDRNGRRLFNFICISACRREPSRLVRSWIVRLLSGSPPLCGCELICRAHRPNDHR